MTSPAFFLCLYDSSCKEASGGGKMLLAWSLSPVQQPVMLAEATEDRVDTMVSLGPKHARLCSQICPSTVTSSTMAERSGPAPALPYKYPHNLQFT